jgi:hypothetical protein
LNKLIVLIIILITCGNLIGEDYLDLNFFIEPEFDLVEMNMVNFLVKNIRNDSIQQFNVFAGQILESAQNDSLTLQFLNLIEPDLVCPTDYLFYERNVDFKLLNSNIVSDSVSILDRYIVETDSISVGFIAAYSPDWAVKNDLASHAKIQFNIFEIVKNIAEDLASRTDYIILLSNMSKYIDADIIRGLPIDVVVSFDYQKKNNQKMNQGKSSFYSILTNRGEFGKLRLSYVNGKFFRDWEEVEFRVGE